MANILESQIVQVIEKKLDDQLERLDNFGPDDLKAIREQRIKEMKEFNQKKEEWLKNGHGIYTELADEKEFFDVSKKSPNIICHFYRNATDRCRIVDMHLKILAGKHVEAKFCKLNAEKSPFLTQRLRISVIPTIALIKDAKTKDFVVGFTDLGNCDDFSTDMMEWRIAQSGVIDYNGDMMTPPNLKKKSYINRVKKTIRGGYDSDDSDIDFDD